MKKLALTLSLGCLISLTSHAQSSIGGISGTGPVVLNCDFNKNFAASKAMTDLTKMTAAVRHCTVEKNGEASTEIYELALFGMTLTAPSSEINSNAANLQLRCTGAIPDGVYRYGGLPMGYATKNSPKSPWFYNIQAAGRCSLEDNDAMIKSMVAVKDQSAMVLLPIAPATQVN